MLDAALRGDLDVVPSRRTTNGNSGASRGAQSSPG
jgi:hypothetical protein